jgi:type I restriction enzyme S subunit
VSEVNATLAAAEPWTARTIGETGKYINGLAFKPTDWGDEGMPIIRIQNLTNPTKPLNKTTRAVDPAYVVNPGDILVSWSATLDAFIWDRDPALLNQHIFKVVPDTSVVTKKFLFYTLKKAIAEMIKSEHLHGSTMKHINRGPFLAHKIEVPTLVEQDEIVAELEKQFSRLDEAAANLQRVKANLKRYKASVLKAAVEGRLVETEATLARREGRIYETGEQLLQRIVVNDEANPTKNRTGNSEHIDCPEGWARASIGEVSEFTFYGPRFSSDAYSDKGAFVLRTTDIDESGRVDTSKAPRIDLAAKDLAKYRVVPGDLLVTRTGSLGTVALFEDKVDAIPGAYLIQIRLRLDQNSRKFLLMFLKSPEGQAKLTGGGAGVGRQNLNAPTIAAIPFGLPPLPEQARIVAEVDRHLSIIREVEAEVDANLQRAQALRQATLARAFSGTSAA